jgi:hypothetical protein
MTPEKIRALQDEQANRDLERRQANLPTKVAPATAPATTRTLIPGTAKEYLEKGAGAIVGKTLRCNSQTGQIIVGDGSEELDLEAIYAAHCNQAQVGFVNFPEDGGQPKRAMVGLFSGLKVPTREFAHELVNAIGRFRVPDVDVDRRRPGRENSGIAPIGVIALPACDFVLAGADLL